jgi:hypothetical protein
MLTQARLKELISYDPETGIMRRISTGKIAGNNTRGYLQMMVDGVPGLAHRFAWLYVHGKWPDGNIDHIDGNGHNNRLENLRDVTQAINTQNNRKARSNSQSGFLGVIFDKSRGLYRAEITLNGKNKYLGRFGTPEEAHEAYLQAKRAIHPGCTI